MKSAEQIEQSIRRLNLGSRPRDAAANAPRPRQGTHTQKKEEPPAMAPVESQENDHDLRNKKSRRRRSTCRSLLVSALGLGTGSVAFSQAGHAVNSTLAWLRQAVVGRAPGEPRAEPPALPTASGKAGAETANPTDDHVHAPASSECRKAKQASGNL